MVGVLELRHLQHIVLAAFVVLAGCSSSGPDVLISAITDELASDAASDEAGNVAASINRAQIEELGVAMIRTRALNTPAPDLLVAFRQNGPQVIYVFRADRRLVLHGGLVQSTEGFGDNLEPIAVNAADPIAFPRPLSDWTTRTTRLYTLSDRGPGTPVRVTCTFRMGKTGRLEIVGRLVQVTEIDETCSGPEVSFDNRHLVDRVTGELWASRQWTGPVQGDLFYEVLEPLTR